MILKKLIFFFIVRVCDAFNLHRWLAKICTRYVTEYDGKKFVPVKLPVSEENRQKTSILFMDAESFRGEISIFSKHKDIRVLSISWGFLGLLFQSFVKIPKGIIKIEGSYDLISDGQKFFLAEPGSSIDCQRQKNRDFFRKFLPEFYSLLSVDTTISSNVRFRNDADITRVGDELGYPHVCFYREAFHDTPKNIYIVLRRLDRLEKFYGSFIGVQNKCTKDLFARSGIIDPDNIIIRGAPRMDEYIEQIKNQKIAVHKDRPYKQIAFFSVPEVMIIMHEHHYQENIHQNDIKRFEVLPIAERTVRVLVQMAIKDPDLRIVFKMKDQHIKGSEGGQIGLYKNVIRELNNGHDELPNVIFETGKMAAHKVIFDSDVVIGIQSTTMLEAAIAEKPVILLHYDDVKATEGFSQVLNHQKYEDIFDVPKDGEDLERIIYNKLENPDIPENIMQRRYEVFEEYVSFLDGSATEKSLNIFRNAKKFK